MIARCRPIPDKYTRDTASPNQRLSRGAYWDNALARKMVPAAETSWQKGKRLLYRGGTLLSALCNCRV